MSAGRCSGQCCASFVLPHPLATFQADPARFMDGDVLAAMLMPLREIHPGDLSPEGLVVDGTATWYVYTCRHYTGGLGGACTIYPTRPDMCRRHGEAYRCPYPDCTFRLPP